MPKRKTITRVTGANLCPMTNKARYDSHEEAIAAGLMAIERFEAGGSHHDAPPTAVYPCVLYCDGWHLTKEDDGKPVENLLATHATTKEDDDGTR